MTAPEPFTADTSVDGNPMLIVHGDDGDERHLQDVTQDRFLMQPPRGTSAHAGSSTWNDPFLSHATPRVDGHVASDPFLAHSLPNMQPDAPPEGIARDPFMTQAHPAAADAPPEDVARDPFMTQAHPAAGVGGASRGLEAVGKDPFLATSTAIPAKVSVDPFLTRSLRSRVDGDDPFLRNVGCKRNLRVIEDVRADPFLAKAPPLAELRQGTARFRCMRRFEIGCIRQRWKCARNCGAFESTVDRRCTTFGDQLEDMGVDIFLAPWMIFMATVLTWIIGGHWFPLMSIFITHAVGFYCLLQVVYWTRTSWTPHPNEEWTVLRRHINFAVCCLLAVVCGVTVGHLIWHDSLRQVWWYSTGVQYSNTTAITPAVARGDAAWIHFDSAPHSTSVDTSRAAGFRHGGHIYCAAPVLSAEALGGGDTSTPRVSYWVVGMDCCQSVGSFTCDASRDRQGAYGVMMLDRGFPCAGCNVERLEAAVAKAEAAHGLVSSENALFIRWVKDPGQILTEQTKWAFMLTMFCFFVALWIFVAIAWAVDRSERFAFEHFSVKRFQGRALSE